MWIRCSAWPALQAATAPLVVALLVGVLFLGPQGLAIQDLGALASEHPLFALAALVFWTLAMAPAAQGALTAPGMGYLRWMPVPTWWSVLHLAAVVTLLHSPLALLFGVAGKAALGLGLWAAGVGLSGSLLLPSYRRWQSLLTLLLVASLLWATGTGQLGAMMALGLASALWQLPRAWRQAAQPSQRHWQRALCGGHYLVVLSAQLLRLWRCESVLLLRGGLLMLLGALLVMVICKANPAQGLADLRVVVLVASTPCLAVIASMLAIALRRGEEELHWLLVSSGACLVRLRAASLILLVLGSCVVALVLAAVAMQNVRGQHSQAVELFALLAAHAAFWACAACLLARRVGAELDESRLAMLALLMMVADMLLVGMAGSWALLLEWSLVVLSLPRLLGTGSATEWRRA